MSKDNIGENPTVAVLENAPVEDKKQEELSEVEIAAEAVKRQGSVVADIKRQIEEATKKLEDAEKDLRARQGEKKRAEDKKYAAENFETEIGEWERAINEAVSDFNRQREDDSINFTRDYHEYNFYDGELLKEISAERNDLDKLSLVVAKLSELKEAALKFVDKKAGVAADKYKASGKWPFHPINIAEFYKSIGEKEKAEEWKKISAEEK